MSLLHQKQIKWLDVEHIQYFMYINWTNVSVSIATNSILYLFINNIYSNRTSIMSITYVNKAKYYVNE